MQALEALKLIAGFGEPCIGKLLIFDGLKLKLKILEVKKDPKCRVCSSI
jgi:adenylyltransferase/sulfurtransferase